MTLIPMIEINTPSGSPVCAVRQTSDGWETIWYYIDGRTDRDRYYQFAIDAIARRDFLNGIAGDSTT
ncbi:MAG: hypothetical protein ACKO0Z_08055 [Betaproteobacteria bacterium]